MGLLSFDDSGGAIAVTLNDIAEMALAHGFEKKGPQTPGKKAAQRADLQAFFQTYGVKAFTPFKEKFESEKLLPPDEHLEKVKKALNFTEVEEVFDDVTAEEYEKVAEEAASMDKKWKLIKKPGGVALKPSLYYDIKGAKSQVENGDVSIPCPEWNEVGAVDYAGKAEWTGYEKWKGKTQEQARAVFCKLFKSAMADPKSNFF